MIDPGPGLTELCFYGDSVFAIKNKALFSRFKCPERFSETEYVIKTMEEKGVKGERVPEHITFEGSGETLLWNNKILVGYGIRNSPEVMEYLREYY